MSHRAKRFLLAAGLFPALSFALLIWFDRSTPEAYAQDPAAFFDRMIDQMPPDAREALEEVLAERGTSIEALRSDPEKLRQLMKPKVRRQLRREVEKRLRGKKGGEPSPSNEKARRKQRDDAPKTAEKRTSHLRPREDYQLIIDKNLFRKLGWAPPEPQLPFRLVGIVIRENERRALLAKEGSGAGFYATVGDELSDGYKILEIDRYSVKIGGGPAGEQTLELSRDMIGASGGGGGPKREGGPRKEKKPRRTAKREEGRWYPPKGLPLDEVIRLLLEREGLTMEDVERNPELEEQLRAKYNYLQEEGYVK